MIGIISVVEKKYKKHKKTDTEADNVMKNGILIGCHQGLTKSDLKIVESYLKANQK